MTASERPDWPEEWKPVPGARHYEASSHGRVRSVDRVTGGRQLRGKVLATRASAQTGYVLVNIRLDDGPAVTRSVHRLVLLAFAGECPDGQESCHEDDNPQHNWWHPDPDRTNLHWGDRDHNIGRRMANHPAKPKPERYCIRCGQVVHQGGRRCHDCVVDLGKRAASLLTGGMDLAEVCKVLEYPSAEGMHKLAVRYGGYAAPPKPGPLRRVTARLAVTLRGRRRGDDAG
jgi:hypothetical protein